MSADRWDEYLVAEHELIERAMAVFKVELEKLPDGAHDVFRLSRAMDFLLEFGDKLHNKKEEELLFPLMEKRGIPSQGGPIAVMLMEHEAERDLIGRMLTELPGMAEAGAEAREKMLREGQEYLRVRAEHIWKENDILYAMGRQALAEVDNGELLEGFARINRESFGEDAQAHFSAMVEELEQGSGAKQKLVRKLSYEQLDAIFEALPFEVTFVDAQDQVAYFNRLDKEKLFPRTRSVIGRKVEKCHPGKSVHMVRDIVDSFKAGTRDEASFWIDFKGDKVLIRYYPVRDEAGTYLGVLEVTQEIGAIQKLEGQKRLLD